jgi:hypothetical protein
MIRHQQSQIQIPSPALVRGSRTIEKHSGCLFIAKLIYPAPLTANSNEIDDAEPPEEMRCVIESKW